MKTNRLLALLMASALMLAGCGTSDSSPESSGETVTASSSDSSDNSSYVRNSRFVDTSDYPSLKELYKDKFLFGCAISTKVQETPEYTELAVQQFNSYTAENAMKPEAVLLYSKAIADPEKYQEHAPITTKNMEACLEYAKANGFAVRGHTLVWHSQTPEWFFYKNYDRDGGELADRDLMLARMENYIKDVLEWTNENYPGLIYAWDVVNEAADDGSGMRQSLWYKTIGEDFVAKAFEFARKYAASDVKLFYNDYNSYQTRKQNDILKFLKPIAEAGNLDGMGMQSHIGEYLNVTDYFSAMKRYHDELGVEIQITELDIGKNNKDDWELSQGAFYAQFFSSLLKTIDEGVPVTSVTLWGLTDDMSWREGENALVFNADLSRKEAFKGIVSAIK
ncbi:MAG: endo-1,4-beta-xylanase [Ruminococcus sp.]|nr:endo-1,4-beta-xylanase [Ruminococcus sp.]